MRIALVGGTGDIGEGLALRFAAHTDHDIVIGSRDAARAESRAGAYESALSEWEIETSLEAGPNSAAVEGADLAVLCVPAYHVWRQSRRSPATSMRRRSS
jgi:predicted dinucleotide-binding enzyme